MAVTGNTVLAPPRLVGDPNTDQKAIQQWLNDFYQEMCVAQNIIGNLADLKDRLEAVEKRLTAHGI